MRDAFEAAKGQLDFVSVTPHAMWPDIPGKNDPRLSWVIDYHTDAFRRLRKGGYQKYQDMTKEYNKEGAEKTKERIFFCNLICILFLLRSCPGIQSYRICDNRKNMLHFCFFLLEALQGKQNLLAL